MYKKTILVVGGAGFIGSYVTKMLQKTGYQAIVFDNLSRGDRRAILHAPLIEGDIGDENALHQLFKSYKIDTVMHFAAFIDVGESISAPAYYYLNNVGHTLTLLRIMLQYQVHTFIFSSSAAIFGYPQTSFIDENHPCCPINPYGSSKWMIENMLKDFEKAYGLKFCCLRYFNAVGGDPEGKIKNYQQRPTNLIPIILKSLKTKNSVTIFGTDYPTLDGTCIRDYIHIEDLGTAHLLGMERLWQGAPSCCYNLGNGQGYSVKEVIHTTEKVTGFRLKVCEGKRRLGDPPMLVANAQKAFKELGWSPRYCDLETMISHAWLASN